MTNLVLIEGEGGVAEPGDGTPIAVPSGQTVSLIETIWNIQGPNGLAARFRFLAPAIAKKGGSIDADTAQADMLALCRNYALARVDTVTGPKPAQIIISLSDRPVPFGETDPEATQYFESYDLEDGDCVWSLF